MNSYNQQQNMMMMGGNVMYNQNKPIIQNYVSPLSEDETKLLNQNRGANEFNLTLDSTEWVRDVCPHRDKNGVLTLVSTDNPDNPNEVKCTQCGKVFDIIDNPEYVTEVMKEAVNILQSIKVFNKDIPRASARQMFPIITILNRVPMMFKDSISKYNNFENPAILQSNNQNPWSMYGMLSTGNYPVMGGYGANPGMMMNQQMMTQQQQMPVQNQWQNYTPNNNQGVYQNNAWGAAQPVYANQQVNGNLPYDASSPFVEAPGSGYAPNVQSTMNQQVGLGAQPQPQTQQTAQTQQPVATTLPHTENSVTSTKTVEFK